MKLVETRVCVCIYMCVCVCVCVCVCAGHRILPTQGDQPTRPVAATPGVTRPATATKNGANLDKNKLLVTARNVVLSCPSKRINKHWSLLHLVAAHLHRGNTTLAGPAEGVFVWWCWGRMG